MNDSFYLPVRVPVNKSIIHKLCMIDAVQPLDSNRRPFHILKSMVDLLVRVRFRISAYVSRLMNADIRIVNKDIGLWYGCL